MYVVDEAASLDALLSLLWESYNWLWYVAFPAVLAVLIWALKAVLSALSGIVGTWFSTKLERIVSRWRLLTHGGMRDDLFTIMHVVIREEKGKYILFNRWRHGRGSLARDVLMSESMAAEVLELERIHASLEKPLVPFHLLAEHVVPKFSLGNISRKLTNAMYSVGVQIVQRINSHVCSALEVSSGKPSEVLSFTLAWEFFGMPMASRHILISEEDLRIFLDDKKLARLISCDRDPYGEPLEVIVLALRSAAKEIFGAMKAPWRVKRISVPLPPERHLRIPERGCQELDWEHYTDTLELLGANVADFVPYYADAA